MVGIPYLCNNTVSVKRDGGEQMASEASLYGKTGSCAGSGGGSARARKSPARLPLTKRSSAGDVLGECDQLFRTVHACAPRLPRPSPPLLPAAHGPATLPHTALPVNPLGPCTRYRIRIRLSDDYVPHRRRRRPPEV